MVVKPARLHFARSALRAPYGTLHMRERGDQSEFLAATHNRHGTNRFGRCEQRNGQGVVKLQQDCISLALRARPYTRCPVLDGRCTSTRSRCGAREAMTVGCKPTTLSECPAARARAFYWFDKPTRKAEESG